MIRVIAVGQFGDLHPPAGRRGRPRTARRRPRRRTCRPPGRPRPRSARCRPGARRPPAARPAPLPSGVTRVNRARSASSWSTSSARISAPGARPTVTTSASVSAAIAATSGSSAFRMATPPSAGGRQRLHQFGLRLGDGLHRAELADVRGADVEHGADPRRRDAGQRGDVPDAAGGQFQHQEAGGLVGAQRRVRVAELVVERLRRGDHLVGAVDAPRSTAAIRSLVDVLPDEPVTPITCRPWSRTSAVTDARASAASASSTAALSGRVVDPQQRQRRRRSGAEPSTATAPAAPRRREVVPVDPLAAQRDEQRARGDRRVSNSTDRDQRSRPRRPARRRRSRPRPAPGSSRSSGRSAERRWRPVTGCTASRPGRPSRLRCSAASQLGSASENGMHDAGDLLAVLVSLAGDDHRVPGAGPPATAAGSRPAGRRSPDLARSRSAAGRRGRRRAPAPGSPPAPRSADCRR